MALFLNKWGDIRGSVADITFSTNRGGAYIRSKVTPLNPKTTAQASVRQVLADLTKAWGGTLTDEQRAAWTNFADRVPYRDVFGNSRRLTGIAMFVKVNSRLVMAAWPRLDTPPLKLSVRGLSPINLSDVVVLARTFKIGYGPVNTDTESLMVETAISVPSSINFVNNLYRLTFHADAVNPSPVTVTIPAEMGALISGTKLHVRAYRLDSETGGVSVAQEASIIIP